MTSHPFNRHLGGRLRVDEKSLLASQYLLAENVERAVTKVTRDIQQSLLRSWTQLACQWVWLGLSTMVAEQRASRTTVMRSRVSRLTHVGKICPRVCEYGECGHAGSHCGALIIQAICSHLEPPQFVPT